MVTGGSRIDWKDKFVELLIVIIGITIAFQMNNYGESKKTKSKEKDYLKSFYEENRDNEENLSMALSFGEKTKIDLDSLKKILLSKDYENDKLELLSASMMALSNFKPVVITMDNITASGDFELISNFTYREQLIDTYNSYETTSQLEAILADYVNQYVTPFFFENIRFSDFTSLQENFVQTPEFENIVIGYDALLTQEINGYKKNLSKLKQLNQVLSEAQDTDKR